ncbi:MAG: thermonuclease family protein [Alphaproteobacteria bacterium]
MARGSAFAADAGLGSGLDPAQAFYTQQLKTIATAQTLLLADGKTVWLAGLDIPEGREQSVMVALDSLMGRSVLYMIDPEAGSKVRYDRWGRMVAQVLLADGTWIQGRLVVEGLARVNGDRDHRTLIPQLLRLEEEARQAHRGLWAKPMFHVYDADRIRATRRFEVVEGRVITAAIVGGRGYLNFGQDRRRDFTVVAEPEILRLFTQKDRTWRGYSGQRIRVRGYVGFFDGPRIDLSYPEQIEVIDSSNPVTAVSSPSPPSSPEDFLSERP